jgi:opacity protein-like surface antigen
MGSLKSYVMLAGILAVATSTTARAADLLPPPEMPHYQHEEIGGNWYLRGDVGVGFMDYSKTVGLNTAPAGAIQTGYRGLSKDLGDQVFVGAGVGYQFNSWLRFDVTGEYRTKAKWNFLEQDTNFFPNAYNLESGHLSSVVGLANVYIDLGNWWGVTPFVGGGIGVVNHMFSSVLDVGAGAYIGGLGYSKDYDKTDLAWAIHAGLAYDVSPNLKLELAYRYLNMGDARTGTIVCQPPACGLQFHYKLKEVESHDFKVGMRWMLGGPVGYEPPPLIRKY